MPSSYAADHLVLVYTNHSDCIVTPVDPMLTVWSAVNRVSCSGGTIGEEQQASPFIAL